MRTWEEVLKERLAADAEEAAEYLRATLEESDAQMLAHAIRAVLDARGRLDDLSLSEAERAAMFNLAAPYIRPELPQAA
jgi:DNA-binding phage protein